MNKKGFTLVELLAVVVILALLALLTSTAVTKLVKDAKDDLSNTQMQLIKSAADTWIADNLNSLPSSGSCGYLTLRDLKYYGLLDGTILDPKNSEEISDDLKIKITTTTSAYGNPVSTTEVNPESIEGCSQIYFTICTIADDSTVQGLNQGAKYNCKVDPNKPEYTFFVLTSTKQDEPTVNMIMDSNIRENGEPIKETPQTREERGLVEWYANKLDNSYGPITAMEYLQTATVGWTNVNPQTISTFIDDAGGIHDMERTFITNARLPYYSEISGVSESTLYLINYLSNYQEITGRNGVNNVYGYWTLSSFASLSSEAWVVDYSGISGTCSVNDDDYYGVRPVITVPVNKILQTNQ